eukprot:365747-Chlamydomonas_euryale.AAC.62
MHLASKRGRAGCPQPGLTRACATLCSAVRVRVLWCRVIAIGALFNRATRRPSLAPVWFWVLALAVACGCLRTFSGTLKSELDGHGVAMEGAFGRSSGGQPQGVGSARVRCFHGQGRAGE